MKIELLLVTHNRKEFTQEVWAALIANTNWSRVSRFVIYDDHSVDGTKQWLQVAMGNRPIPNSYLYIPGLPLKSPVAAMKRFIPSCSTEYFCKIDSDTIVPPGWLDECLAILEQNPHVDLLGIEPMYPVAAGPCFRAAEPARYIGGIGFMRKAVFSKGVLTPKGRFGFTEWQDEHVEIQKAWIVPALPVFLLDRLPIEPYVSLSKRYEAEGWQRPWGKYRENDTTWAWWVDREL